MHTLLLIGGLNWGLVGAGHFLGMNLNVVNMALGSMPMVENAVYALVGVAAVMGVVAKCKKCS